MSNWSDRADNIVDVLEGWADRRPEAVAVTCRSFGTAVEEHVSYGGLAGRARSVAGLLSEFGKPGDLVFLCFGNNVDFVCALFGCFFGGMVAVPVYPLSRRRLSTTVERLASVAQDSGATCGLCEPGTARELEAIGDRYPALSRVAWRETGSDCDPGLGRRGPLTICGSRAAIVQYTSGSTGSPKGVIVTHDNIMHNERMINRTQKYGSDWTFVTWLPVAHDWGLFGNVLQPVYCGARSVLLSAEGFLRDPMYWLATISGYPKVTSGGPNFAYELCCSKISESGRDALQLAGWLRAGVGAGRVHSSTLARFVRRFGSAGFKSTAFYNGYGLAEATLSVAASEPDREPTVLRLSRYHLERGIARRELGAGAAVEFVGSGRPNEGQVVSVIDPSTRCPREDGRIGEICVAGRNVTAGYWGRTGERAGITGSMAASSGTERFLRTGDLGFVYEGELFVTGRLDDVICLNGRNIYPEDVERIAEGAHGALRKGGAIALGIIDGTSERLVLVVELREPHSAGGARVIKAINRALFDHVGVSADDVVLVAPRTVPKTSSGKPRRSACRRAYLENRLDRVLIVGKAPKTDHLAGGSDVMALTDTEARLFGIWSSLLGTIDFGPDDNFVELGGQSILAQECLAAVKTEFGIEVSFVELVSDEASLETLAKVVDLARKG